MAKLQILVVVMMASLVTPTPDAAEAAESCRFRVAAIRAEIAAKPDRSDLVNELAAAERLCKRGEIGKAVTMLSDIVAKLRSDG